MSDGGPRTDHQRRLAALGSLVAGAAALLLALAFTVESFATVVAGVLGVALTITGGWYAVCNRGRGRVAGISAAVIGLLLALAGLVAADTGFLRLALAAALAAASVAAARFATGRRPDSTVAADLAPPAPPARQGVLIMNLKSGGGKAEANDLVDACRERGIEPVVLGKDDDLREVAERAVARGADVLGMAGGDGSLGIVAAVARDHDLPFVVVPAGTRNHFALDLGLDRGDVTGALDAYRNGVSRKIDLAQVNDRVFVNNVSLGLYAEIVSSDSYRDAKVRTALAALPDLLGPDAHSPQLRLVGLEPAPMEAGQIVLISNNPYTLNSVDGWGTRARLDSGVLGVASLTLRNADDARRLIALEAAHQLARFGGLVQSQSETVRVESDEPEIPVAVDGESLTMSTPVRFEILPSALTVQLPANAPGRSPAARSLGWGVPRELVGLAAGRRATQSGEGTGT